MTLTEAVKHVLFGRPGATKAEAGDHLLHRGQHYQDVERRARWLTGSADPKTHDLGVWLLSGQGQMPL